LPSRPSTNAGPGGPRDFAAAHDPRIDHWHRILNLLAPSVDLRGSWQGEVRQGRLKATYTDAMAFIVYTGLRLLLLVLATGVFYLIGMRGLLVLVMGFIASGVLSWFLLDRQRARFGAQVQGWFGSINDRIDEASRKEDIEDEQPVLDVRDEDPSHTDTAENEAVAPGPSDPVDVSERNTSA